MMDIYSKTDRHRRAPTGIGIDAGAEAPPSRELSEVQQPIVEEALRRLALFLEKPLRMVERNVPGSIQEALSRLPWERRLRRRRDQVVLQDLRLLWEQMDADDLRRARLKFLLEHAERRSRL